MLENMTAAEINRLLILLARDRGSSYKPKANPRPDVREAIRRIIPTTRRVYLDELRRRRRAGEKLVQQRIRGA